MIRVRVPTAAMRRAQVDAGRGLADPALLVGHGEDTEGRGASSSGLTGCDWRPVIDSNFGRAGR